LAFEKIPVFGNKELILAIYVNQGGLCV